MDVWLKELPFDAYESVTSIFGEEHTSKMREDFNNNCYGLADTIKRVMDDNQILAEIITFKNGNVFVDEGIKVYNNVYTHHTVVLMGEWVIDLLHTDEIIKTKDYILKLKENNPKLRIDYTLSTCWYTADGFPYKPSLQNLLDYKC